MRLSARVRAAIYAALLGVLLMEPRVDGQAGTLYVDNTQGDCSDAAGNPGTSFATPLCTPVRAAQLTNATNRRVEITSGLYRTSDFGAGVGTTLTVTETTTDTEWVGMGNSPDDVRITNTFSTTVEGLTITKTPGYTNIWQFDPPSSFPVAVNSGSTVAAVGELGRWTDPTRDTIPAYAGLLPVQPNGVEGYLQFHNLTAAYNHMIKWRASHFTVSGTTLTIIPDPEHDRFSQMQVGKRLKMLGGEYEIVSVESYTSATIDESLPTLAESISVTTLTSVGTTATATTASAHNYFNGMQVLIAGASPSAYNGYQTITVTGSTTFTYTFAGGTSPATGTKTSGLGNAWIDLWVDPCPTDTPTGANASQCKPPSLDSCLGNIDGAPGTFCQDKVATAEQPGYTGTQTVYFHPRTHHRLTSLTSSGTTATGTCERYCNYQEGETVIISGATPTAYNGTYVIDVVGTQETSQSFTYTFAGAANAPATGTLLQAISDGTTLNIDFVRTGNNPPTCQFAVDRTKLSNVTCIAMSDGMEHSTHGGAFALELGGDNSHIHDVWSVGGRMRISSNIAGGGLNDFLLEDFKALNGMVGCTTCSDNFPRVANGFTIQDGEAAGGATGAFGWSRPWGTDNGANVALIQRLNIHDSAPVFGRTLTGVFNCGRTQSYDFARDIYDITRNTADGSRSVKLGNGTWCTSEAGFHEYALGDEKVSYDNHNTSTNEPGYVHFFNNVVTCVSDAHSTLGIPPQPPTTTEFARLWNNTFRCNGLHWNALNPVSGISFWNNFHTGYQITGGGLPAAIGSSGYNYIFHNDEDCPAGTSNPPFAHGGSTNTIAQFQALGLETNTVAHSCDALTLASLNTLFTSAEIMVGTDSPDEDFRLVSGSPLIDAGDDAHCAHTPGDGDCDIGAFEFGEDALGPPATTTRYFIAGTAGGDAPPANSAPVASAGFDQTKTFPETAQLNGGCNDSDTNTVAWTEFSGPGDVTFTPSNTTEDPVASFSEFGVYVLRITCTDTGALSDTDDVTITIEELVDPGPNTAPNVNAGPDQQLEVGDFGADLNATVTDNGAFSVLWEQLGGPAAVSFGSTSSVDTTVTFPQPGNYTLRLNATDAASIPLTTCDDITINVQGGVGPPPGGSTPKRVRLRIKL